MHTHGRAYKHRHSQTHEEVLEGAGGGRSQVSPQEVVLEVVLKDERGPRNEGGSRLPVTNIEERTETMGTGGLVQERAGMAPAGSSSRGNQRTLVGRLPFPRK